jgi:ATP-dependent exoDNAse (exonuclease V) beta subunit
MHAAKGLEWPIVIPVNTMTGVMSPDSAVVDRQTDTFYCPVMAVAPDGYDVARRAEKDELDRERIRLWHVAATRARDLLVLPRLDTTPSKSAWIGLLDLSLADLPGLDVSHLPLGAAAAGAGAGNAQTRATFATEAAAIAARQTRLHWLAPSRDESASGAVLQEEEAGIWLGGADDQRGDLGTIATIQGGRERGLILHKLMEEVLTGEPMRPLQPSPNAPAISSVRWASLRSPIQQRALQLKSWLTVSDGLWPYRRSRRCGRNFWPSSQSTPPGPTTASRQRPQASLMH